MKIKLKNKIKQNKGITLIALVVTIIVLLILAGISIQMLVGEGGILTNAREASDKTKNANEDEQVKLAVAEAISNGVGTLTTENVKKALENEFGTEKVTKDTFTGNGPWTFKGERNTYTIESTGKISSKPPVKKDILTVDDFTEANYGDYITNYGIDIDGDHNVEDDWRIFYMQDYTGEEAEGDNLPAQGKRIFLIASDYVRADMPELVYAATEAKMKSGDDYRADYVKGWSNGDYPELNNVYPGESDEVSLFPNLFLFKKFGKVGGDDDFWDSMKCAASLLNVKNWERFTKEGYSDYAIGAPTLQMFQHSWNSSHHGNEYLVIKNYEDGVYEVAMGAGTGQSFSASVTLSRS